MNTHFAGTNIDTNTLRASLACSAGKGDRAAAVLLRSLADKSESTAGELVNGYRQRAGSESLETVFAGIGLASLGLVLGVIGLAVNGAVAVDVQNLMVLLVAFVVSHFSLIKYSSMTRARLYGQQIQKLANILKVSSLARVHFDQTTEQKASRNNNLQLAYGCVSF